MQLATFRNNFWQLRDAEACHAENPESFWIPSLDERQSLHRGQSVRLIFDIEAIDDDGAVVVSGERMWVTVAEKIGSLYIGILENQPVCLEPSDDVYLTMGAEIPFAPRHVIDICDSPEEYVQWQLGQPPSRFWPRD